MGVGDVPSFLLISPNVDLLLHVVRENASYATFTLQRSKVVIRLNMQTWLLSAAG
jgi:hypothetical protein